MELTPALALRKPADDDGFGQDDFNLNSDVLDRLLAPAVSSLHYCAGDGVADDSDGLEEWAAAAANTRGYLAPGTYKTTRRVTIPSGAWILGAGRSAVVKPTGTGFDTFFIGGSGVAARNLAADAAEGASSCQLGAGDVAALGLVEGDLVRVFNATSGFENLCSVVTGIAGDVVTLADPLYWTFTVAKGAQLTRLAPAKDVRLSGFAIDGAGLTNSAARARGVMIHTARDCYVGQLYLENIADAAVHGFVGYHNDLEALYAHRCGSANESDLHIAYQTGARVRLLRSLRSTGFGPQLTNASACDVADVRSVAATNRAFKLQTSAWCRLARIVCARAGNTGLGISVGSRRNMIDGAAAIANTQEGIWFDGSGCSYNTIKGAVTRENGQYHLAFNAGDTGNYVEGDISTAGLGVRDLGTDNVWIPLGTSRGLDVRGAVQLAGAAGLLGFFGAAPAAKPAVTGSRGGNAALASLLSQLAALGLVTDSSTA